jgi:RNA polymerase sigma-70 factor (ECF subfamily)
MPDTAAFEELYRAHRRHVLAYCLRRASETDAFEAADETFLVAWRRFDEIPPGNERAWLYGVAYHVLGNQYRSARRRRQLSGRLREVTGTAPLGPEAQAVVTDDQRNLRRAYERLSRDDQEVLRLSVWEELPHEQVAVALDCTTGAARQRLHRARKRLAQELRVVERPALALTRRRHDA